jgi:hypothetical protein
MSSPQKTSLETTLSHQPILLSEQSSLEDLFSRMMSPDREIFMSFKSLKVETCFIDRIFIVYKPQGLNKDGTHRPPEILTQIKVLDFRCNAEDGAEVDLEDLTTHEVMTARYIPQRLFRYDVFVGVAPKQRLNWDAKLFNGTVRRSLSFMMLLKVRSPSSHFSHSVTGIETPVKFRELFPDVQFTLNQTS